MVVSEVERGVMVFPFNLVLMNVPHRGAGGALMRVNPADAND
jgi:hypothetical protein